MKIAIIGAGVYGCHIADRLINLGFDVKIFEKNHDILNEASGNNQYRLHLGFHYARNFRTRSQSRDGFFRFIERYGKFTREIASNYYLIPTGKSLIDFRTYKSIMMSSGLDFVECSPPDFISNNISVIKTDERVILIDAMRDFFRDRLSKSLVINFTVNSIIDHGEYVLIENEKFDYVIDCTWGHHALVEGFFFEPTILFYYKCLSDKLNDFALTFVDGQLLSLYPTENSQIYTLSSVTHTPLGRFSTSIEARNMLKNLNSQDIDTKRIAFESEIVSFYKNFIEDFEYMGVQLSIKTKPTGSDDDRSCYVQKDKVISRKIICMSGKIDNLFYATSKILDIIGGNSL
jgi:hypothetical protein